MLFAEYIDQSVPLSGKLATEMVPSDTLASDKVSSDKVSSDKVSSDKESGDKVASDRPALLSADAMKAVISSQDTQSCAIT